MKTFLKLFSLALVFFYSCNTVDLENISGIDFIPTESHTILNINDLDTTKEIFQSNPLIPNIYSESEIISSRLNDLTIRESKNGILSLSPYGKDQVAYTFVSKIVVNDSIFQNEKFDHIYQNNNIYSRKINDETIFMTLIDNFFISSNRDLIIENIIRDLKSNKKLDSELLKISKTLDTNEPFNILVRSKDFSNSNFMLRNISTFPKVKSSWIGYDFQNSLNELKLNGVTRINDSINSKLSLLSNIPPSKVSSFKIIPDTFKSSLTITISDSERFIFNLKNYLKVNDIYSDNFLFSSISLINEVTVVSDEEDFIILGINSLDQIKELFKYVETNDSEINSIEINEDLKLLLNYMNFNSNLNYASIHDDLMIITNSISQLRKLNNLISINKVLSSNSNFINLMNKKSEKYNFIWIANSEKIFDKENNSSINFDDYPFMTVDGILSQDIALLNTSIIEADKFSNAGDTYTEFIVSTNNEIITNPIWLKNHLNDEYDFVFQDSSNYLYQYSNNGNLNWKRELSGKIIGDIEQIDIYKNGRLQLLFRTSERLYLLDRNGNEVEELSIDLDGGININPISVFDYEKNRNYRIVVTSDNQIRMYDSTGKIVSGFKPVEFSSNIINNPVHIRIDGKDYLVFQLENGEVKILNRRGEDRIIIDEKVQYSKNNFYSYLDFFTTSDSQGNLIQINTDGEFNRVKLDLSSENYINVLDDNLVYISNNTLSIKGINVELPPGRYSEPKIFNSNKGLLIGTSDLSKDRIYLYDDKGKLINGFPLEEGSSIDLVDSDKDGKLEIISRMKKYSVVSYEIN